PPAASPGPGQPVVRLIPVLPRQRAWQVAPAPTGAGRTPPATEARGYVSTFDSPLVHTRSGWQYAFEGFDCHLLVDAGGDIGIRLCPVAGFLQRLELGHHQASGKSGLTGVVGVDGRMRSGEQ